ncbi:MAG: hypothetical protein NC924_02460 [Candidatus Omnitrophica bacterium]|nr:hypothetical protein [Candidatus Omnitrophota bacterium]
MTWEKDFGGRKIRRTILIVFAVVLAWFSRAAAESNPVLLQALNEARQQECTSKRRCEHHEDRFNLSIPYHQIIAEKEQVIAALTALIVGLGGTADAVAPARSAQQRVLAAMAADARAQIELISLYDRVLGEFGHPETRRVIAWAKNMALSHFLMLSVRSQELLDEQWLSRTGGSEQPQ